MSLFRKHKPAHQLVATRDQHKQVIYRCSVCTRTFFTPEEATEGKEYCPGKCCYVEFTFGDIPAYLMPASEIKATGRTMRKHQEPLAYKHYELIGAIYGPRPIEYIPLYDIRECLCLDGAITLPAFDE